MISEKPRQLVVDLDPSTGAIVGLTRVYNRTLVEGGKEIEVLQPRAEGIEKDQWDDVLLAAGEASAGEFAAAHQRSEEILAQEREAREAEKSELLAEIARLRADVGREALTNQQLTAIVGQIRKIVGG